MKDLICTGDKLEIDETIEYLINRHSYMNILDKIIQIPFEGSYIKTKYKKTQIILHHTVSGGSAKAVASYWASMKPRIATCIIIDKAGIPYQLFSSRYWGGHVGGKKTMLKEFNKFDLPYRNCSKSSIGVELISWGGLKNINDKLYTCYGNEIEKENTTYYEESYRGYNYFDTYTKEQIKTLQELLIYWKDVYNIPLDYYKEMWDVSYAALNNMHGVWVHNSFRSDKSDLAPQKELIDMLQNLNN